MSVRNCFFNKLFRFLIVFTPATEACGSFPVLTFKNDPVPIVSFKLPGWKQPDPYKDAAWSAIYNKILISKLFIYFFFFAQFFQFKIMILTEQRIGISTPKTWAQILPKSPVVLTIFGKMLRGILKSCCAQPAHSIVNGSKSPVAEALETSQMCWPKIHRGDISLKI